MSDANVKSEVRFWEDTLIMYVLGRDLSMTAVRNFMIRFWDAIQLSKLFYHDDGCFGLV